MACSCDTHAHVTPKRSTGTVRGSVNKEFLMLAKVIGWLRACRSHFYPRVIHMASLRAVVHLASFGSCPMTPLRWLQERIQSSMPSDQAASPMWGACWVPAQADSGHMQEAGTISKQPLRCRHPVHRLAIHNSTVTLAVAPL